MKSKQSSLIEFLDVPVVTLNVNREGQEQDLNCYSCTRSRYCSKFQDFLVLREKLKGMKQLALDSNIIKAKEDYKHLFKELKKVRSLIWKCTRRRTFLFGLGYKTFRIGV
ncbi:MAG: hypothetical protein QXW80_06830 [Candidatus Micrarchaeia archaeon]